MWSSDTKILSFPSDFHWVSSFEIPEDSSTWFSKHFVWVCDGPILGSLAMLTLTSIQNVSGIHWQESPALCFRPASVQKPEPLPSRSLQFEKPQVYTWKSWTVVLTPDEIYSVVADQSVREEGGVTEKVRLENQRISKTWIDGGVRRTETVRVGGHVV